MSMARQALVLTLALAATGCTAELKEENTVLGDRVRSLESDVSHKEAEIERLKVQVADLQKADQDRELAASLGLEPGQHIYAHIQTSMGAFVCELEPEKAPRTVANFVNLAEGTKEFTDPVTRQQKREPYYDGVIFHRVIPGFMIQTGDRTGTGRGGPGFTIPDEFSPTLRHKPGTLSMANRGPNTGGAQFFITEVATPHLDDRHSVFGYCDPVSLVKEIANVPRDRNDRPIKDVVLQSITIHRGEKPKP